MKIHDCAQGEADWNRLRLGKVTASEMDNLLTPTLQIAKGDGLKTYLYRKIAEAHFKRPIGGFTSHATDFGIEMEDEARRTFCFEHEHKVCNVGFVESDDGRCGCSPDMLLDDDGGLELKCPQETNHIRYLLEGVLPRDYAPQVHMSMYVTGRRWWKFMSFHRGCNPFVLTVQRDEKICATIAEALAGFYEKFDAAMAKLRAA